MAPPGSLIAPGDNDVSMPNTSRSLSPTAVTMAWKSSCSLIERLDAVDHRQLGGPPLGGNCALGHLLFQPFLRAQVGQRHPACAASIASRLRSLSSKHP